MPSHEEHCQDSLERYGKRFDELHSWMDEPSSVLLGGHQIYRHDPVATPPLAKKLFGELADQACLDHMRFDELEKRRLKKEKAMSKTSKIGYWKNHQPHKPSMIKEVTDYCGNKFLDELIEKCDETKYIFNRDFLRRRDKCFVSLLFLTGGRISEVLMLRKNNFDFNNEEAKRSNAFIVKDMGLLKHRIGTGKRKRMTRTFPIWNDDPLVQHFFEWLPEIDDYLFPSDRRKNSINRSSGWRIVSNLGKRLDMPAHINPSWFRMQREYYLIRKKDFSPYDVQAYLKLRHPPKIFRHREDWQNLLAITRKIN